MRIARFLYRGRRGWGVVEDGVVRVLRDPPFSKVEFGKGAIPLARVRVLPPAIPTKIVLVGLNYRDHARELKMKPPKEPIFFLKPPTALIAHGETIIYPQGVKRVDYEAELAVVIKKEAKNIREDEARRYVLGYTCLNDVTARDIQRKDIQWTRAKSFDTFCPLGPWVETDLDPDDVRISSYLDGELRQDSSTSNFIFSVGELVAFISRVMTLLPGDVISTGTPPGVGEMKPFSTIEVEIEGIGRLRNRVVPQ
jgi:2-keto-4-pentenoate hydratase/2-oxohepta-3-ene-1,7-dioic acid hydratase in catechol pathway